MLSGVYYWGIRGNIQNIDTLRDGGANGKMRTTTEEFFTHQFKKHISFIQTITPSHLIDMMIKVASSFLGLVSTHVFLKKKKPEYISCPWKGVFPDSWPFCLLETYMARVKWSTGKEPISMKYICGEKVQHYLWEQWYVYIGPHICDFFFKGLSCQAECYRTRGLVDLGYKTVRHRKE